MAATYTLADFDFDLPPELIAQHPAPVRSAFVRAVDDDDDEADKDHEREERRERRGRGRRR